MGIYGKWTEKLIQYILVEMNTIQFNSIETSNSIIYTMKISTFFWQILLNLFMINIHVYTGVHFTR